MPYCKPPKEHQFKKGVSPNPGGKPKYLLTPDRIKTLISKYMDMGREQLQRAIQNPNTPAIELAIASTIAQCIKLGDYSRLEALLARSIGRVTDKIEIAIPKPYIIETTNGNHIEMGAQIIEAEQELLEESDHEN
jgi:hypothetical protein